MITAQEYDAHYYGMAQPVKSNYTGYGPDVQPHWAVPLAMWITSHAMGPYVDIGCAYGHLLREIRNLKPEEPIIGIEWSPYSATTAVIPGVLYADAKEILPSLPNDSFGCTISMDFLEHHEPSDTAELIKHMCRITRPSGLQVHLIGALNHRGDNTHHWDDPTHQNHEPMAWYLSHFWNNGWRANKELSDELMNHPAWNNTDWAERIFAFTHR